MKYLSNLLLILLLGFVLFWSSGSGIAGYKSLDWNVSVRDKYPARLTSEGVTIAAEPLFTNALAAQVFDKKDIVTRGIMPLAIVIFNDNDYPIEVDGLSIELIRGDEHFRTLTPEEAVNRVFAKGKSIFAQSMPKVRNAEAQKDFNDKFLMDKTVGPHDKGGGFLYMRIYDPKELAAYLSTATVYIPHVYRGDDGSRLIYFEIELKAAVNAVGQN
jgi:hypothetical protein